MPLIISPAVHKQIQDYDADTQAIIKEKLRLLLIEPHRVKVTKKPPTPFFAIKINDAARITLLPTSVEGKTAWAVAGIYLLHNEYQASLSKPVNVAVLQGEVYCTDNDGMLIPQCEISTPVVRFHDRYLHLTAEQAAPPHVEACGRMVIAGEAGAGKTLFIMRQIEEEARVLYSNPRNRRLIYVIVPYDALANSIKQVWNGIKSDFVTVPTRDPVRIHTVKSFLQEIKVMPGDFNLAHEEEFIEWCNNPDLTPLAQCASCFEEPPSAYQLYQDLCMLAAGKHYGDPALQSFFLPLKSGRDLAAVEKTLENLKKSYLQHLKLNKLFDPALQAVSIKLKNIKYFVDEAQNVPPALIAQFPADTVFAMNEGQNIFFRERAVEMLLLGSKPHLLPSTWRSPDRIAAFSNHWRGIHKKIKPLSKTASTTQPIRAGRKGGQVYFTSDQQKFLEYIAASTNIAVYVFGNLKNIPVELHNKLLFNSRNPILGLDLQEVALWNPLSSPIAQGISDVLRGKKRAQYAHDLAYRFFNEVEGANNRATDKVIICQEDLHAVSALRSEVEAFQFDPWETLTISPSDLLANLNLIVNLHQQGYLEMATRQLSMLYEQHPKETFCPAVIYFDHVDTLLSAAAQPLKTALFDYVLEKYTKEGEVAILDCISQDEKDAFKTYLTQNKTPEAHKFLLQFYPEAVAAPAPEQKASTKKLKQKAAKVKPNPTQSDLSPETGNLQTYAALEVATDFYRSFEMFRKLIIGYEKKYNSETEPTRKEKIKTMLDNAVKEQELLINTCPSSSTWSVDIQIEANRDTLLGLFSAYGVLPPCSRETFLSLMTPESLHQSALLDGVETPLFLRFFQTKDPARDLERKLEMLQTVFPTIRPMLTPADYVQILKALIVIKGNESCIKFATKMARYIGLEHFLVDYKETKNPIDDKIFEFFSPGFDFTSPLGFLSNIAETYLSMESALIMALSSPSVLTLRVPTLTVLEAILLNDDGSLLESFSWHHFQPFLTRDILLSPYTLNPDETLLSMMLKPNNFHGRRLLLESCVEDCALGLTMQTLKESFNGWQHDPELSLLLAAPSPDCLRNMKYIHQRVKDINNPQEMSSLLVTVLTDPTLYQMLFVYKQSYGAGEAPTSLFHALMKLDKWSMLIFKISSLPQWHSDSLETNVFFKCLLQTFRDPQIIGSIDVQVHLTIFISYWLFNKNFALSPSFINVLRELLFKPIPGPVSKPYTAFLFPYFSSAFIQQLVDGNKRLLEIFRSKEVLGKIMTPCTVPDPGGLVKRQSVLAYLATYSEGKFLIENWKELSLLVVQLLNHPASISPDGHITPHVIELMFYQKLRFFYKLNWTPDVEAIFKEHAKTICSYVGENPQNIDPYHFDIFDTFVNFHLHVDVDQGLRLLAKRTLPFPEFFEQFYKTTGVYFYCYLKYLMGIEHQYFEAFKEVLCAAHSVATSNKEMRAFAQQLAFVLILTDVLPEQFRTYLQDMVYTEPDAMIISLIFDRSIMCWEKVPFHRIEFLFHKQIMHAHIESLGLTLFDHIAQQQPGFFNKNLWLIEQKLSIPQAATDVATALRDVSFFPPAPTGTGTLTAQAKSPRLEMGW